MKYSPQRRNLICVLDWGLGHASRSLALAQRLEEAGEVVLWASAGAALDFLRRERPEATIFALPTYAVRYPSTSMIGNVLWQAPRWLRVALRERSIVKELVLRHRIDRIISDNRFGCYDPGIPNVWLSHQLHPIVPLGWVGWAYRRFLRRHYQVFWVPDDGGEDRLSGKLSAPEGYGEVVYVGQLSRLGRATLPYPKLLHPGRSPQKKRLKLLLLLSGPEPMRNRLEEALVAALHGTDHAVTLVRGLPAVQGPAKAFPTNWIIHQFADAESLRSLLVAADLVVCRSGYSTMMDLMAAGKPMILIPTPGQTEQEYLARRAQEKGWAAMLHQPEVPALDAVIDYWKTASVKKR